jgi:hypothetical protein
MLKPNRLTNRNESAPSATAKLGEQADRLRRLDPDATA